jgi:hypothetical protein
LNPYYQSKQVIGLLNGLPDAIVYNNLANRKTTVGERWQGYALGLNAMALILIVGALASGAVLIVNRRREQEEAEKAAVAPARPRADATAKPVLKKQSGNGKAPATATKKVSTVKAAAKAASAKAGARKAAKKK